MVTLRTTQVSNQRSLHRVTVCLIWVSEQTAVISIHNMN